MITVTLEIGAHGAYTHHVGVFCRRKLAFREAKRAVGIPYRFVVGDKGPGYEGPNGTAWIAV
jgi:hypothetical protein